MSIENLFPNDEISEAEVIIIAGLLSHISVKRYLKVLAMNDMKELALLGVTERDNAEVAKKHALIQGKLSVLSTLMSIQPPQLKE